jgi:DNA-directed RNA polymerase subunit beta
MTINKYKRKSFITTAPNFIEIQLNSFCWFLEYGLNEELSKFFSTLDFNKLLEIRTFSNERLFHYPNHTEFQCKKYGITYAIRIYIPIELINGLNITNSIAYFGEIPLMTSAGTFIVSGCERIIINQLIRSAGIYYKRELNEEDDYIYSAILISNRGSWIKFELDVENTVWIRLNQIYLLNIYNFFKKIGLELNNFFLNLTFPKILIRFSNNPVNLTIYDTVLNLDLFSNLNDKNYGSLIYPGTNLYEIPNLCSLVFDINYYNLDTVGRLNLNYKLNLNISRLIHNVTVEDIIAIIRYLMELKSGFGVTDDIDHIKNKRIKSIGELLQTQFNIGLIRLEKTVRERLTICNPSLLDASSFINPRPIIAVLKEFFGSSQLSQFMDQTNPLSGLTHKRRISRLGPGGLNKDQLSFNVRDIHSSHYGRICPIETPEGKNAGLMASLASYSRINSLGFIETPFFRVKKGIIYCQSVPIYLTSGEESFFHIAPADISIIENNFIKDKSASIRYNYNFQIVLSSKIKLAMISPIQIVSIATALIPFLEHNDANRALMGSNMQRQAVPLLFPKKPIIGTGIENQLAINSGVVILSKTDGTVKFVSSKKIRIDNNKNEFINYFLEKYVRSNQDTCINQRPIIWPGEFVSSGQIIADGPSTNGGELALGQNILVAYMSWEGYNYEDALIINERLVFEDIFTSIHIEKYDIEIRQTKYGVEEITRDLPNINKSLLDHLDEFGIVKKGVYIKTDDILVGKITPKSPSEQQAPESKLLTAIFGEKPRNIWESSLRAPPGSFGRVIDIRLFKREKGYNLSIETFSLVRIFIAQIRKIQIGDKISGRHGNKGIISRVLSREDMPYLLDGTPIDIILNPLGIPSRMNVGQILETLIGLAGDKLNTRFKILPFDEMYSPETSRSIVNSKLNEAAKKTNCYWLFNKQIPGRMILMDGRTGNRFDNYILVGKSYIVKLIHQIDDKVHARSTGPYSLITQQPLGGRSRSGGQRFGEMEVWALQAFGSAYTLQEILTLKSDDVEGRNTVLTLLVRGSYAPKPNLPESFKVLIRELHSLGLDIGLYKFITDYNINITEPKLNKLFKKNTNQYLIQYKSI